MSDRVETLDEYLIGHQTTTHLSSIRLADRLTNVFRDRILIRVIKVNERRRQQKLESALEHIDRGVSLYRPIEPRRLQSLRANTLGGQNLINRSGRFPVCWLTSVETIPSFFVCHMNPDPRLKGRRKPTSNR